MIIIHSRVDNNICLEVKDTHPIGKDKRKKLEKLGYMVLEILVDNILKRQNEIVCDEYRCLSCKESIIKKEQLIRKEKELNEKRISEEKEKLESEIQKKIISEEKKSREIIIKKQWEQKEQELIEKGEAAKCSLCNENIVLIERWKKYPYCGSCDERR